MHATEHLNVWFLMDKFVMDTGCLPGPACQKHCLPRDRSQLGSSAPVDHQQGPPPAALRRRWRVPGKGVLPQQRRGQLLEPLGKLHRRTQMIARSLPPAAAPPSALYPLLQPICAMSEFDSKSTGRTLRIMEDCHQLEDCLKDCHGTVYSSSVST